MSEFLLAALSARLSLVAAVALSQPSLPYHSAQGARVAERQNAALDAGAVANGMYRNKTLAFTCKIPAGWVLRTEELNARDESTGQVAPEEKTTQSQKETKRTQASAANPEARVLLAAFSRPPEARGEEVNSSIVIAVESMDAYPGLKEAVQYLQPLAEVATAQGFTVDEEPYEIAIGTKVLVREDFHKDVGTRVMRQSTMAMLAHGYAVSFTVIAGTEDDVEELIDGLDFGMNPK